MPLTSLPVSEFLSAVASPDPTPGGGSASALAGALGAALVQMVASMPSKRATADEERRGMHEAARQAADVARQLRGLVDRDSEAYQRVMAAYRLPKSTDEEKAERSARIQQALKGAAEAPLEVMRLCAEGLQAAEPVARWGNRSAASDIEVAIELLRAACRGARLNVDINLESIKDAGIVEEMRRASTTIADRCESNARSLREAVRTAT